MIVLINGSFGVGKTTVARLIRQALPASVVYDPERAGWILQRMPSWLPLAGAGTDDYQDIQAWRTSAVTGTRIVRAVTRRHVIVPMAFSRRDYFDEIVGGFRALDGDVRVYCLRAQMATILARLERRGANDTEVEREWLTRKVRVCVDAHRDAHFGEPIDTEGASATEVARAILTRIEHPPAPPNA